jgi:hypothetical protein
MTEAGIQKRGDINKAVLILQTWQLKTTKIGLGV